MEVKLPDAEDVVITTNPTITIRQIYTLNIDTSLSDAIECAQYLYVITTPRLRYLNKFRIGRYMGSLSKFIASWKARNVDINILRFVRTYLPAYRCEKSIMDHYESQNAVQDGWIKTSEFEFLIRFDNTMEDVKFENIDYAIGALKIVYMSRNKITDAALGMVLLSIRSLFDVDHGPHKDYYPIYNSEDILNKLRIEKYDEIQNEDSDDE